MKRDFEKLCLSCKDKYVTSSGYVVCNKHFQLAGDGWCKAYEKEQEVRIKNKNPQSL